MKQITFYLDFVSPYAWLAFERLPHALKGLSYSVKYRPILLGALLQAQNNPGSVGIPAKRDWTYRHATWLGHVLEVPLQMPSQHPFNSRPLLHMALACSRDGSINRFTAGTFLRHVWQGGLDAMAPARLDALGTVLAEQYQQGGTDPQNQLWANIEAAADRGVFGVPTFEVDGKLFWGLDSLPMLRAYLAGDAWFERQWNAPASIANGLQANKAS